MKTLRPLGILAALFTIALALVLFTARANAQTPAPAEVVTLTAAQPDVPAQILTFVLNAVGAVMPASVARWVVAIATVMGAFRIFFKPFITFVEHVVRTSPTKADDEILEKVEHSPAFKAVAWAIDFFASFKFGPQWTAKPEGKPTETNPAA